ncbi:MAG: hypothetical protein M1829_001321 [Trizodia sp. TS-e1964]|nr:MAG: hypothetical protein M1829_001321 [Trizodia sp. TS-e1964]
MVFRRSASGPGSLSINTGSANSLFPPRSEPGNSLNLQTTGGLGSSNQASSNLLGSSAQPQATSMFGGQSTGLFGSKPAPQASSTFGNQTAQAAQTTSLFGTQASQPAPGAGLFGTQPAKPSGGLFGALGQPTPSQANNSLFGALGHSNSASNSLLGGQNATPRPAQSSGGLFGSALGSNTTQAQAGGGLFSSLNTQPKPSLFGTNTTTQQPTLSLFASAAGGGPAPPNQSLFGLSATTSAPQQSSLFTSSVQDNSKNPNQFGLNAMGPQGLLPQLGQQQQNVPGVRIDLSQIRGTTRFGDLHEEIQRSIEQMDSTILAQAELKQQIDVFLATQGNAATYIPNDVEHIERRVKTLEHALQNDVETVYQVKDLSRSDINEAQLCFRAIETLKLPPQYHQSSLWNNIPASYALSSSDNTALLASIDPESNPDAPKDIVAYFSAQADAMGKTLAAYGATTELIEAHLRGLESHILAQTEELLSSRGALDGQLDVDDKIRELRAVFGDFEGGIMNVASNVGAAREAVQRLILGVSTKGKANGHDKSTGIY